MRTTEVDLFDRVEEIETEELPEKQSEEDELMALINEEFDSYAQVPKKLEERFDGIQNEKATLRGEAKAIREELIDWSSVYNLSELTGDDGEYQWGDVDWDRVDSVFTIAKLNAATFANIEDEVVEKSFEVDPRNEDITGSPKTGYGRILVLERAIVDAPEGSPHKGTGEPKPGEYDNAISEWLFDVIDRYNTTGEVSLGNSSLRDRMEKGE